MGADQSVPTPPHIKSQRDDDLPFTAYSINKPIDSDTPKASPRLATKVKGQLNKEHAKDGVGKHEIIVVAEGSHEEKKDPALQRLEEIPAFLPIMKTSVNLSNLREPELLERLDHKQLLYLCIRYQEHLKQCAEAVAFDQNALCVRIKEVDFAVQTIYNTLTEKQRKCSKWAEQIQKIQEMQSVLNKVKFSVQQTIPLMERLNNVLPPEEQLEPFSMKIK